MARQTRNMVASGQTEMTGPTRLESKAAFIASKLDDHRVTAARVLQAIIEWNALPPWEKASYRLPADTAWSEEDTEILRDLWSGGALPPEVLDAFPDRSYSAITHKAHREGIQRPADYLSKVRKLAGKGVAVR